MFPHTKLLGLSLYNWMYALGFAAMLGIHLCSRKKYGFGNVKTVLYTVMTFIYGVLGALLMGKIQTALVHYFDGPEGYGEGGVCIFGALLFLPVMMYLFSLVSKDSFRTLMDYTSGGIFAVLAAAKFGCVLAGCCYGVPSGWGVHNARVGATLFPVQIFESACTILVVALVLWLNFGPKELKTGLVYPIGAIAYCVTRFFWEFFRHYDEDSILKSLMFGLTFWQFFALLTIVLSIAWMIAIQKFEDRLPVLKSAQKGKKTRHLYKKGKTTSTKR